MNQFTFDFGGTADTPELTMAVSEQPQQRLEQFGVRAVSDTELLAMVLQGNGTPPARALKLATRLMGEAGSLQGLAAWGASDYRRTKGIGPVKGLQLSAITEIGRRMMATPTASPPLLNRADLIASHFAPIIAGLTIEKFWTVLLNRKNRLIRIVEITSGTATAALAHPREVFRQALRDPSPVTAICAVHNHPSGCPEPSAADTAVTRQLREAAKAVEIDLIDHVIVGRRECDPQGRGYFSYREAGIL